MVAWGPIIAAAVPAVASLLQGGGSSATVDKTPGPPINANAGEVTDSYWNILNNPDFIKTIQGEADWGKAFHLANINRGDESLEGYVGVLRRMQDYERGAERQGNIGGIPIDILPKSAERISDRMGMKAQDIFEKTKGQDTEMLGFGLANTPAKGFLDYLARIERATEQETAGRRGLPSQSAELEEPFDIEGLIKGLTPLYEGFDSDNKRPSVSELNKFDPEYYD